MLEAIKFAIEKEDDQNMELNKDKKESKYDMKKFLIITRLRIFKTRILYPQTNLLYASDMN